MKIFLFVSVLLACVALGRWFQYPCHPRKLRYAFGLGPEEHKARTKLKDARWKRKDCADGVGRSMAEVERDLAERIRPSTERVGELTDYQETLRQKEQDPGEQVYPDLWPLRLCAHALLFLEQEAAEAEGDEPRVVAKEELPLDGLVVDVDTVTLRDTICLRVTVPGSSPRRKTAHYSRAQYGEPAVDAFAEAIRHQVPKDEEFRRQRRDRYSQAASEIVRIEADRAKIGEEGRLNLDEAKKRAEAELSQADAELSTARDNWKKGAGLRPWW